MSLLHIVSPSSAEYRFLADITEPSKIAYATKWNLAYSFPVHTGEPEDMMWQRVQFMLDGLDGHEWELFMGADTIITNLNIQPGYFLPLGADLVFAVDENGLQSDVLFIRNCEATKQWLRDVQAQRGTARCEQDAMSVVLGKAVSYTAYRSAFHAIERLGRERAHELLLNKTPVRVEIINKTEMNSTREDWIPGDFIFHAAAMQRDERVKILTEMAKETK